MVVKTKLPVQPKQRRRAFLLGTESVLVQPRLSKSLLNRIPRFSSP